MKILNELELHFSSNDPKKNLNSNEWIQYISAAQDLEDIQSLLVESIITWLEKMPKNKQEEYHLEEHVRYLPSRSK
jgi:hypothetical protein